MSIVRPACLVVVGATVATMTACSSSTAGNDRTTPFRSTAASGNPSTGAPEDRPIILRSRGLGSVRFGSGKAHVTQELTQLLGPPSGAGNNPGCGPAFTEVQWGELAVEFHQNVFSGYRDINRPEGSLEIAPDSTADPVQPRAETAAGIGLGDSLSQARAVYAKLSLAGANRWRAPNGLNFVDNSVHSPARDNASIIEIRIGTCGSF